MHFKLIIAVVQDDITDKVIDVTREAGATGATIVNNVRGEGMDAKKGFFGLSLDSQRDMILLVVEEHLSRDILEAVEAAVCNEDGCGLGIAMQVDIEDLVGAGRQIDKLQKVVEENL
jgi:nitrogen regulatory protein PII